MIFSLSGPAEPVYYTPPYGLPALSDRHRTWLSSPRATASKQARTLRLVSRQWRNIATPIFWKVVSLHELSRQRCVDKIKALGTALAAQEQPGKLIRELILHLNYAPIQHVGWIVARCPHLRSLVIDTETYWSGESIEAHLWLPESLQNFRYQKLYAPQRPFPQQLISMVDAVPNLTSFSFTHRDHWDLPEVFKLSNVVAFQLHRIPVEDGVHATFDWELPRMTHLTILGLVRPQEMAFMQRFGQQLTFLELPPWADDALGSSLPRVFAIIALMPSLRELVIATNSIMRWLTAEMGAHPNSYRHPTITHLGFKGFPVYGILWEIIRFAQELQWPALRCVRLMEDPRWGNVRVDPAKIVIPQWRLVETNIAVEDGYGRNILEDHGQSTQ